MATPRVTIDALPEQTTLEDTNYFVLQDTGVSKKASWATIKNTPSQALLDHINDTDDANDATAVSTTDSGGGINGTTVQSQLGQVATQLGTLNANKLDTSAAPELIRDTMGTALVAGSNVKKSRPNAMRSAGMCSSSAATGRGGTENRRLRRPALPAC